MDALVLVAGRGTRLLPYTTSNNKCMVEVDGEAVISRTVRILINSGIKKIYVLLGHCGENVASYLEEHFPRQEFIFIHNKDYATSNNIVSYALGLQAFLKHASFSDGLMTIEGDLLIKPSLIEHLLTVRGDMTSVLSIYNPAIKGTVATLNSSGVVDSFILGRDQPATESFYCNKYKTANIYLFRNIQAIQNIYEITIAYIRKVTDQCYYEEVFGKMVRDRTATFRGLVVDSTLWYEIDDWDDYYKACYAFSSNKYELLSSGFGGYWNYPVEDFAFPYNALFPCRQLLEDLSKSLSVCLSTYSSNSSLISDKIGHLEDITDTENIYPLNGLCQIYPILRKFIDNTTVLIPRPTFGEYERLSARTIYYDDGGDLNILDIEDKLKRANVVVFVNPNNPTGTILPTAKIAEFALKYPDKIFLVDESFLDFSEESSLVYDCPTNLVVLKSLGKSYGVPGLRLGYLYTKNNSFVDFLNASLPIWNTNSVAERFMELCLHYKREYELSLLENKKNRSELRENLMKTGIFEEVLPSEANFFLCKVSNGKFSGLPKTVLETYNIFIKDVTSKFHDDGEYCRITVKTSERNEYLCKCLSELHVDN